MFHSVDMSLLSRSAAPPQVDFRLSTGAAIVLGMTGGFCFLLISSIRYTLWGVVSTLAMVEEPQFSYRLRIEKANKPGNAQTTESQETEATEAEVTLTKPKPITSKIRSTIRYLQSRAGFTARWRGLAVFCVYAVAHSVLAGIVGHGLSLVTMHAIPSSFFARPLASALTSAALARLSTTWVHIVISEPSAKRWWRRVPAFSSWKHLAVPCAVVDFVTRLAFLLPLVCAHFLGISRATVTEGNLGMIAFKGLVCAALGLLTLVSLVIPATVTLVRIQASLLPEEDESIVPFDRTFGGKVVPQILGGSGTIGFADAWRTFGMPARARIVKLFFKFIVVEIGLHVLFTGILIAEAIALIGPENIRKLIDDHMKQ